MNAPQTYSLDVAAASTHWHPVATEHDLAPRSLFRTKLLGHELVVWRADDGFVNVWENRCLHRGVRLSIGANDGTELVCRYHAWRYANRTAGCTYIPAHPADSPARTITNKTFPVRHRYGLVWSGHDPLGEAPEVGILEGDVLGLRNQPVDAPVGLVLEQLAAHRFLPTAVIGTSNDVGADLAAVETSAELTPFSATLTARMGGSESTVVFFVQPVDAGRSVIRPVLAESPIEAMSVLRHHAAELSQLARAIEREAHDIATQPALPSALEVPVELPTVATAVGRSAPLRVSVRRKWNAARDIAAFELVPTGPALLPTFQPGAHIDVHLADGLIRQYSITNGPGETDCYRIAVKRDPNSAGGSVALHDSDHQGDELQISEPRNSFPLRRNLPHTILIAGGIGVTPLLAMAQALRTNRLGFELHYFVRGENHVAFADVIEALGPTVIVHQGLDPAATGEMLTTLLAEPGFGRQVYACGPGPMLDAIRASARSAGWADDAVHFEYFQNPNDVDLDSTFEVSLSRSARTLTVAAGETILDVLRADGISVEASCEQGACGTCVVPLLDGRADHQDVYLSDAQKATQDRIAVCVSRAETDRLVLEL